MRTMVEEAAFLHSQGVHRARIAEMLGVKLSVLVDRCRRAGVHLDTWNEARSRRYVDDLLAAGHQIRFSVLPEWVDRRVAASVIRSGIAAGRIEVVGTTKRLTQSDDENIYSLKVVTNVA